MFQRAIDPSLKGMDQLIQMGKTYLVFATEYPLYRQALDYTGIETLFDMAELKKVKGEKVHFSQAIIQRLRYEQQRFVTIWTQICALGQKDGTVTQKYPPQAIAFTLGTMTTGFVDELVQRAPTLGQLAMSRESIFNMAMDFLYHGLEAKDNGKSQGQ